ncbi:MAG: VWA domain-containing protein [Treponema sp.]|nr:VWA domain-containing protein [Treponema sp.]
MKKVISLFFVTFVLVMCAFADDSLLIRPSDIRLVPESNKGFASETGYHLYIRKKDGMESIMLTETTKDPEGHDDNYAYRAMEWNAINGDEVRYLDGKPLTSQWARYSLIDSTVEDDPVFGKSFHIYIPATLQYGYPWERNGVIHISKGTFINIRAFSKPFGDYTGSFADNPFMFDLGNLPPKSPVVEKTVVEQPIVEQPVVEQPIAPEPTPEPPIEEPEVVVLTDDYNPIAAAKFEELSELMTYSKGPETIVDDIMKIINAIEPKENVDCVFAIDATGSMQDDIDMLRKELIPRLLIDLRQFKHVRLGLLLYRDYVDSWRYKGIPVKFFDFTDDLSEFLTNLNSFTIKGIEGGDIPEAVYEAMYGALSFYDWDIHAARRVILIGDAEPHPRPRGTGKYTKQLVQKLSDEKDIHINAIILPDDKSKRGR